MSCSGMCSNPWSLVRKVLGFSSTGVCREYKSTYKGQTSSRMILTDSYQTNYWKVLSNEIFQYYVTLALRKKEHI